MIAFARLSPSGTPAADGFRRSEDAPALIYWHLLTVRVSAAGITSCASLRLGRLRQVDVVGSVIDDKDQHPSVVLKSH